MTGSALAPRRSADQRNHRLPVCAPVTRCYLCLTPIGGSCTGGTSGITCDRAASFFSNARRESPMHDNTWLPSAVKRTLTVATLAPLILMIVPGTSSAESTQEATAAVPGITIAGMSITTLAWLLVGLAFLAGGLIAASKSGRRASGALLPGSQLVSSADTGELGRPVLVA